MFVRESRERVVDLILLVAMSIVGYFLVKKFIVDCSHMFVNESKVRLFGKDLNKVSDKKIPEAQGLWCGVMYFIIMFLFMPICHREYLKNEFNQSKTDFIQHLAGLLSICCMILLGFVDDVLDLRWRHKLLLPTIASLPLLIVYYISHGTTNVVVPIFLRHFFGDFVDIGVLYYIYMGMLAVFCTNAINIYAGINGIEAGQSFIIAISVCCFNAIEFTRGNLWQYHIFSLFFMIPYVFTCLGLLHYNWYPSDVFVGDTFCYFSGMTFAVAGILGHFSKTLLLFFIPQIINFLYSIPQLFHFIPCPRHRLPRYIPSTDKVTQSTTKFKLESLSTIGKMFFIILKRLRLIDIHVHEDGMIEINNLTIINLALRIFGDQNEGVLTKKLLLFQIFTSLAAFFIRYPIAWIFYEYQVLSK